MNKYDQFDCCFSDGYQTQPFLIALKKKFEAFDYDFIQTGPISINFNYINLKKERN